MPCYMTGSAEGDAMLSLDTALEKAQQTTRLLCEVCEFCDTASVRLPDDVETWWSEHKAIDAARKREEQKEQKKQGLKDRALGKLTIGERKALGLL